MRTVQNSVKLKILHLDREAGKEIVKRSSGRAICILLSTFQGNVATPRRSAASMQFCDNAVNA